MNFATAKEYYERACELLGLQPTATPIEQSENLGLYMEDVGSDDAKSHNWRLGNVEGRVVCSITRGYLEKFCTVNVWRDSLDECTELYGSVWILDDGRVVQAGSIELTDLRS